MGDRTSRAELLAAAGEPLALIWARPARHPIQPENESEKLTKKKTRKEISDV